MIFSQFWFWRRVFVKRVALFSTIGLAATLAACSSQGISFDDGGGHRQRYSKAGSIPIPSEPVYGHTGASVTGSGTGDVPYWKAAAGSSPRTEPFIERSALAPVKTASYSGQVSGGYVGSSYAMQPIGAHDSRSSPYASQPVQPSGERYAQASSGYYGQGKPAYQPSYSDYRSYRRDRSYPEYTGGAPDYDGRKAPYRARGSYADGEYYTVVEGDTLFGISRRYGITTLELAELNGITGSTIYAGQKLRLRGGSGYTFGNRPDPGLHYGQSRGRYGDNDETEEYVGDDRKAPPQDYAPRYGKSYGRQGGEGGGSAYQGGYDQREGDDYEEPRGQFADKPWLRKNSERYASRREDDSYDKRSQGYDARHGKAGRSHRGSHRSYSVRPGDTLYDIARQNGLNHRELAAYNDIPYDATLYPGQVLHLPVAKGYPRGYRPEEDAEDGQDEYERSPQRGYGRDGRPRRGPYSQKTPEPEKGVEGVDRVGEKRLAKAEISNAAEPTVVSDAAPEAVREPSGDGEAQSILAAHRDVGASQTPNEPTEARDCDSLLSNPTPRSAQTFREPVQGLIIAKFGSAKDGSVNDGVDFSVPKGTPVKAAENGVVAYVGNELAGFGNLILIRHADGYVTAYAHNDEVLVRRCDMVQRGQIISKAGASGNVTKPQLHFEVRKNSKPVDPEAYFSRS